MNKSKFYLHTVLYNLIYMSLSGTVIQTFFIEKGVSENNVNVFLSVMQIVQIATILLFMKKSDNCKNVIKFSGYVFLLNTPITIFLTVLSCFTESESIYWIMYLTGVISNICFGIYNVLYYKLPYHIMNMKEYGRVFSISGVIVGITCALFSFILFFMQKSFGYFQAMKMIYIFVLMMLFAYVVITNSFKAIHSPQKTEEKTKISILKYKPFNYLIVPNILRGFSLGIIGTVATIGYYENLIDTGSSGIIVIITYIVTIVGCFMYSRLVNRVKERNILLFSSIAVAVFMPLIVVGNTFSFMAFYAIDYFFVIIINYSVPVTVTKICDYKVMGQYSAGRMLLNTLGTSLAGFVCIPMIDILGVTATMFLSGIFQLISGLGYYFYIVKGGFYEDHL